MSTLRIFAPILYITLVVFIIGVLAIFNSIPEKEQDSCVDVSSKVTVCGGEAVLRWKP